MQLINRAYLAILAGGNEFDVELSKPWVWAKEPRPGVFVIQPPIHLGNVAVVNGSNKVTLATPPSTSLNGSWLKLSDRYEWFRVIGHAPGGSIMTIDCPDTDQTASAIDANAVLIDYTLAPAGGILRLIHPFVIYRTQDYLGDFEYKLYQMDQAEMLKNYPMSQIMQRTPAYYCVTYESTDGKTTVRMNSYPFEQVKVEYEYIKLPELLTDGSAGSVDSEPLIPLEHRDALTFAASYFLCVEKNDSRQQQYLQQTQAKLKGMQKASEKEKTQTASIDRGRLVPRQDQYWRTKRRIEQTTS